MSTYLRPRLPGASVFFTVALAYRGSDLLVREVARLRDAVADARDDRWFGIDAWVVLPGHLHTVWTLPEGDADYSTRWGAIKARFTRSLREDRRAGSGPGSRPGFSPAPIPTELPVVRSGRYAGLRPGLRVEKREQAIWQRRFWEHHIRDDRDWEAHVRYCWWNPVKHGLAERPTDWTWSSIHRDIRAGRVEAEWMGAVPEFAGQFGEC
jgi:putative transposase